jgi:hypothetical protein
MPSDKQQLRLLLDPATAHAIHQISLKESRSSASACNRLIDEALRARRAADNNVNTLVNVLKGIAAAESK